MNEPLPGFEPFADTSPWLDLIGPLYCRRHGRGLTLAVQVDERHVNRRGLAHGGLIATLADLALGKNAYAATDPPAALLTASLKIDYLAAAKLGDWITSTAMTPTVGASLAFADCYLTAGDRRMAHASAVFKATRAR